MSPLKIYEYLAGGGPVAATDLPPLRGIEGPLELRPPGGDFVAAVRAALAIGPMDRAERQRFVEPTTPGRAAPPRCWRWPAAGRMREPCLAPFVDREGGRGVAAGDRLVDVAEAGDPARVARGSTRPAGGS